VVCPGRREEEASDGDYRIKELHGLTDTNSFYPS
jgi:hypothetical protein